MVASQNSDSIAVSDFQRHKQRHSLHRVVATVHVVSHEQVVGVRWLAADLEQLHEVVELPVDVAAHCDGALHRLHVLLFDKNLTRLRIQTTNTPHTKHRVLQSARGGRVEGVKTDEWSMGVYLVA